MAEHKELYFPQGVRSVKEVVPGFGKQQVLPMLIMTGILSGIVAFVVFGILGFGQSGMGIVGLGVAASAAASFVVFRKEDTNESIADTIVMRYRYARSQKHYRYKALDEWSVKKP